MIAMFPFRTSEFSVALFVFREFQWSVVLYLQESSESKWGDIVFIPPGFDVSTDPTEANSK